MSRTTHETTGPRIVILGGGFAGAYCAQKLNRLRRRTACEVVLIDQHNYFIFYPLLVEAGTGGLEPRHAVVPVREFTGDCEFRMARVIAVDVHEPAVTYRLIGDESDRTIACDHLVLAPGSVTMMPENVPGLREHGRQMKSLNDAVSLRDRAIELLELANAAGDEARRRALLSFVVVGGAFTGTEVAGEFDMFLSNAAKRYPNLSADDVAITLVEIDDRILKPLGEELSDYAMKNMRRRGIDLRLGDSVTEIHEDHVVLESGGRIDAGTAIWTAGIQPHPLIAEMDVPTDERGYILCERDLRVKGFKNVWAIGDGAVNIDAHGNPYPATAQHATREGEHCARNLAAVIAGRNAEPCDLKNLGSLAALGCRTGVAKVFGLKLSGFWAWWLWRTVYLLKMPTISRKFRVALDWTIDLLFSRDYVQLGVHSRPGRIPDDDAASDDGGDDEKATVPAALSGSGTASGE